MSAPSDDSVGYAWTPRWLRDARRRAFRRWILLAIAVLLGLGTAWLHWLGLVAGGMFVGVCSRTVPRAIGGGVAFGGIALAVTVLSAPTSGPAEFVGLTPISYLTIGTALLAPVWGSLVRAVI
ncbi:MAG: hypothetical protein ABEH64_01655 [Salinirussus sp.]